jgi:hypothetical protein
MMLTICLLYLVYLVYQYVSKNCRYEWVSCFNGNDGKWILDVNKSSEWFYLTKFHMFSDKIVVFFLVFFSSIDVNKIV